MQVIIKGASVEMLIYTISLVPEDNQNLYLFHCINCGNAIAQYQGAVAKIYPIVEPVTTAMVVSGCRKCGSKYTFQTHRYYRADITKVVLHPQLVGRSFFYCHAGRGDPLLIYTDRGIYSNVEQAIKQLPFTSRCMHENCDELYSFVDLV